VSEYEAAEFAPEPKSDREGLPRGYRMRADSHYVDSLTSPRESRGREAAARASLGDPLAQQADRRLFDQLAEDVAAIESAAAMLAADASPLSRRVGLDLIKAQSARAAWLLRATALIGGAEQDTAPRRKPLAGVLSEIRDRLAVECRLVGVGLEVEAVDPADLAVWADPALAIGITGAVLAQLGLLNGADQPVIRLRATGSRGELVGIEVSQDATGLPVSQQNRFFDPSWTARPGGWLAALGAAAAKSAADRLGGSVSLVPRDTRGCTIRLSWE
jgi:C4-dicarboxylate-specific signal transduction histidine kinase